VTCKLMSIINEHQLWLHTGTLFTYRVLFTGWSR
jgi:hypothetical protein